MITKLKRNFIVTSMAAVTILLIAVFVAQNIINHIYMNEHADRLLNELSIIYTPPTLNFDPETGEPADSSADSSGESAIAPADGESLDEENAQSQETETPRENTPPIHFGFAFPVIDANAILSAVYFTVTISPDGEIVRSDLSRIADLQAEEAEGMALEAFETGRKPGWFRTYKFTFIEDNEENRIYIFLHRAAELNTQTREIAVSVIIVLLCFVVLLLLVMFLANKSIKPIAINIEKQKDFVTYASHEIKTPLAIIQANTEALELHNGENKWTKNIKDQIMRLSILMTNMLTLSRAEDTGYKSVSEELNLTGLVEQTVQMFREGAHNKNVTIENRTPGALAIRANKTQIGQLLSIVLDNAVKYSREGSAITLTSETRDKEIILEISNATDLMPECDPERLFDRFYRPDASRFSKETGNGIGLSAARAIIETYGGSINCRYEEGNRVTFIITFKKNG